MVFCGTIKSSFHLPTLEEQDRSGQGAWLQDLVWLRWPGPGPTSIPNFQKLRDVQCNKHTCVYMYNKYRCIWSNINDYSIFFHLETHIAITLQPLKHNTFISAFFPPHFFRPQTPTFNVQGTGMKPAWIKRSAKESCWRFINSAFAFRIEQWLLQESVLLKGKRDLALLNNMHA